MPLEPISNLTAQMAEYTDRPGCFERVPPRKVDKFRVRPDVERHLAGVDDGLRVVLRELTAGKSAWPLFLHGPVGVGKTRAALVVCDLAEFARYWTVSNVLDLMADSEKEPPWTRSWGRPGMPSVAILDELGTRDTHADARGRWEYDAVKHFLDWRDNRPAIYISNHTLGTLEKLYDKRIASRLGAGTQHFLDGPDRRIITPT